MKKTLILLLLLGLLVHAKSIAQYQKTEITVGKPYEVIDAGLKFYFAQGNEIMTVKIDRRVLTIQKFNSDNLTFQKAKVYDDFDKNFVVEYITGIRGHYYLFYSQWDGDNEQLFAREINFKEGSFVGKGVKLFAVNHKISGDVVASGFYRYTTLDKFQFTASADSSKLLIQYRLKPETKRDSKSYDVIGMNVFDHLLKEQWRKEFTMPYTEKKMDNVDFTVDRSGNAYIIARVYDKEDDKGKRDEDSPDYSIELLKMSASTKQLTTHPMSVPNKYLRTLRIYETPKGELVGGGFYNKDQKTSSADGVFVFNVSKDMKVSKASTHEIPLAILNQNVSNKQERKNERKEDDGKAEFQNMQLADIEIEPDGSTLLIGEQYFMKVHYQRSPGGGTSVSYSYHYNDILVTKIKPDGSLAWMKKVPKRQQGGAGRGGMSFRYFVDKDDYYFVFLDNLKNLDLPKDELPARHIDGQGGFLALHMINDKTGEVSKSMVLDTRDVKGMQVYQFAPSRIVATGRLEFVFEAYKKKKEDVLVKVKL